MLSHIQFMPARNLISGFVHFLRRIRSLKNTKRYFLGWTDTQMGQKGDKGQWWWWAGGVCSLSVRLVVYAYFWAFLNYPFKKESSYICAPKCSPLKGSRPVWTSIMNATYTQAMQQRSLFNQAPENNFACFWSSSRRYCITKYIQCTPNFWAIHSN